MRTGQDWRATLVSGGRFFIGVTSTGIYCRPICPAPSPKPSNVRYYPSAAAAAEAGFPALSAMPSRGVARHSGVVWELRPAYREP